MLKRINLEEVKKVLYYHYKKDISFPRSCSSVSMSLALMMANTDLSKEYDIYYHRGHFRNDEWVEEGCFLEYDKEEYPTRTCFDNMSECSGCTCDFLTGHSWIELIDKNTNKVTILDFTSIQFDEDICDLESDLKESNFNKDEFFDFMLNNSNFVVNETDDNYIKYIKTGVSYEGNFLIEKTKETIKENAVSSLSVILENINYKL